MTTTTHQGPGIDHYLAAVAEVASAQNLINLTLRYFPHQRLDAGADARYPAGHDSAALFAAVTGAAALTITWKETCDHWIARDIAAHRVCYTQGALLLLC